MTYETTTAQRAEDDKLQRGIVDAARDFLSVGTPAGETAAARKERATAYQLARDDQRARAKRVSSAGVEATLRTVQKFTDTLGFLSPLTAAERAKAITAIGEIIRDLQAYQQMYRPRPVEIKSWAGNESTGHPGSRTRW